jgi:hypothetical protein
MIKTVKKIIAGSILIILLLLFYQSVSFAQDAVLDYAFQEEKYREIKSEFEKAKSQYLKHKSVSSEKEALDKTKSFLIQRNSVMNAYFLALIQKLNSTPNISSQAKDENIQKIQTEIKYLEEHVKKYIQAESLSQAFAASVEFEEKKPQWAKLNKETISLILIVKTNNANNRLSQLNKELKPLAKKIDNKILNDWLTESESLNNQIKTKIEAAKLALETIKNGKDRELEENYYLVSSEIDAAREIIKRGINYQKALISQIEGNL